MDQGDPRTIDFEPGGQIPAAAAAPSVLPERIGRYRIERLLGKGGFGIVYLARDEDLNRLVAVKVPHAERMGRPEDVQLYLVEARTVASLDHPHIVPVYDVGSTAEYPFFVVSKFVDGADLATTLKESRLSWRQAAELVASVAEALHFAHKQGLVHRDVKPGNILIDRRSKPYLVDFGLALREENVGKGPRYTGTAAYMSPEQARGEGHRVDGRSDIFSLGTVLYELLVNRVPFQGDTAAELLEQITSRESRPPRQCDDTIPRELERICLKALSKRAAERYTTAHDLADDLRHFLDGQPRLVEEDTARPFLLESGSHLAIQETPVITQTSGAMSASESRPVKIVPKGLRSFDAHDADFFLELLPGPRDRDGLPDGVRFWKTRIEETDADATFAVGLVYGPSGCGKSSLVKAGLLPRLTGHVLPVYIEATAKETETRLLYGLRKRCPALPGNLDLKATLSALRRGDAIGAGKKVLIVLDQFEQWLHARRDDQASALIAALRQCDGGRVQSIVMVRDDFWMAVTRFLADLEVELVQGRNIAAVDLFDPRHAQRVLKAFGRAYGILPENAGKTTLDQQQFLDRAITGLTQDGKVICVRLALFAEMMKGKPWTLATLKEVGGTEGLGATFLEETFCSAGANPMHRMHQKAARAVLKALLPELGTQIKGNLRPYEELKQASGYAERHKDFEDLIRILDSEIRLITPGDPEGNAGDESTQRFHGPRFYQLTHDYLVPSLRDWLTRKQKETRRGRAELRLAERAAAWNAKPENRLLPSLWECGDICLFTHKAKWTSPERKMMAKAGRVLGIRSSAAAALVVALLVAAWELNGGFQARSLVKRLVAADIAEVPSIVAELEGYRRWANPLLRQEDAQSAESSGNKVHLGLGLLSVDQTKVAELRDKLSVVSPRDFVVVRDALLPFRDRLTEPLWQTALDSKGTDQRRFQAACALASYAPQDPRWAQINKFVAARLVTLEASPLVAWRETLRPAKAQLLGPLARIYRDASQDKLSRSFASETLADYAANQPDVLFELLADSELFQFPVVFDKLAAHNAEALAMGRRELAKRPDEKATEDQKETLAKRQANAAVALVELGTADEVWPLLRAGPDPRVRSYVIHWLGSLGAPVQPIAKSLDTEPDVTIRRALVLALGQFPRAQLSAGDFGLVDRLMLVYENEPDAGLHSAAEWLLTRLGRTKGLETALDRLKSDENQLRARKSTDKRRWYVNMRRQTFVIVDARDDVFVIGSPLSEPDRSSDESQHRCRLGRRLAIASHEVTKSDYAAFQKARPDNAKIDLDDPVKTPASPQGGVTWFEAAAYCNWLSEVEGIAREQWCYEPNKQGKYAVGMKAKEKFWRLSGYRLPTEAEWEYACRAGAATSRNYGLTETLLGQYAWYQANGQNRSWPVGTREPNDWGLFDMLGNAFEWCFDEYLAYPKESSAPADDAPSTRPIEAADRRVMRGGAFHDAPQAVRSAFRAYYPVDARDIIVGFRVARTFP